MWLRLFFTTIATLGSAVFFLLLILESRLERLENKIDKKYDNYDGVRLEKRLDRIEEKIDKKYDKVDGIRLEKRLDRIEEKFDKNINKVFELL